MNTMNGKPLDVITRPIAALLNRSLVGDSPAGNARGSAQTFASEPVLGGNAATIAARLLSAASLGTTATRVESSLHLRMPAETLYWIDDPFELRIVCQQGSVWLTIDGDPHDVVISAGESITPWASGRLLVSALQTADIELRRD